jgi:predicted GIY-YIG superfamily endonuclease
MTVTIYRLTDCIDQRSYVGSTKQEVSRRFAQHRSRLKAGIHPNTRLQEAYDRHSVGAYAFELVALEVVEEQDRAAAEQRWIDATPGSLNVTSPVARSQAQRRADRVDARVLALLGVDWLRKLRSSPRGQAAQEPPTDGRIER